MSAEMQRMLAELQTRLTRLEREQVRLRIGEVTDDSPLSVALGGSEVSYAAVARLGGAALGVGDQVAALAGGNDLLVLDDLGTWRPHALIYNGGALSIGHGSVVTANMTGELWDVGTDVEQHSTSVNTSRLVCRVAGQYLVNQSVVWDTNANGVRYMDTRTGANQLIIQERRQVPSDGGGEMMGAKLWRFAVGDYIEARYYQTSGGTLGIGLGATSLAWTWLNP